MYAGSGNFINQCPHHLVVYMGARNGNETGTDLLTLVAQTQYYWSDNQVSCTAEFDPDTEAKQIPQILADYEKRLKAIVFLPSHKHGYKQLPYEEITEDHYKKMISRLKPIEGELPHELEDHFCDDSGCQGP